MGPESHDFVSACAGASVLPSKFQPPNPKTSAVGIGRHGHAKTATTGCRIQPPQGPDPDPHPKISPHRSPLRNGSNARTPRTLWLSSPL